MASPDPGRTSGQGEEAAAGTPWPLRKLQSLTPGLWSQYKTYEEAVVENTKGTIKDALVIMREHQTEAIGFATLAGLILFRGPRRFLYRNTFGRFKTEKDLLNDAEQSMMEYRASIDKLKKDSKYTRDKIAIGESDLQRGRNDLRYTLHEILCGEVYILYMPALLNSGLSPTYCKIIVLPFSKSSGKQIQSLIGSIYKAESAASGLMDRLRTIPTRQSLELRAEVASMASNLKDQRCILQERIKQISEYGVRV